MSEYPPEYYYDPRYDGVGLINEDYRDAVQAERYRYDDEKTRGLLGNPKKHLIEAGWLRFERKSVLSAFRTELANRQA